MTKVLLFLLAGIAIGSFANLDKKKLQLNSRLQFLGLMLLLFIMGSLIGMDKELLHDIKTIGVDSFAYAASAALFSILFVYIATKNFFERR